jgi:beta-lactamase superfamily II metal-dependent hydrolase
MTDRLVVRMYNVGFGDCFLLTIPTAGGPRRMLIDCGTHPASTGPKRAERDAVPVLIEDLKADGSSARIDVVAVSHRHKDHVSGFTNKLFADVEVGEVWLPWTEDPDDATATKLRNRMGLVADGLVAARDGFASTSPGELAAGPLIENNFGIHNQAAMELLWTGFRGKPKRRYLAVPMDPIQTPVLPGVTVHLLGPSRDEATLRNLEPPANETFAHFAAATATPDTSRRAFDAGWSIPAAEFESDPAFENLRVSEPVMKHIRAMAAENLLAAAAALESSVNGTSLMFVLEVGGLFLFFPGDAQWGTWNMALEDPAKRDLIKRSAFYKIGHHGSHNASPETFVGNVMSPDTWAAISVASVKKWADIPLDELIKQIGLRSVHVVRSDQPPAAGAVPNVTVRDDRSVDFAFDLPAQPVAPG